MSYQTIQMVTQFITLALFIAMFIGVLIYTFWPANQQRFERAARLPLEQDPPLENEERA